MKKDFYLKRSRFDEVYSNFMLESIICEDALDEVAKFKKISDQVKTYVGTALQTVASASGNPIIKIVLKQLGKRGLSAKVFKPIGKYAFKYSSTFAGGGAGGTSGGGSGAGAGAASGPGAIATGAAGAVSGGGLGAAIGLKCRKIFAKFGEEICGFLGACNDYVSQKNSKKAKVDEDYGVKLKEAVEIVNAFETYNDSLINEDLKSKVMEKVNEKLPKVIGFFRDFLLPIFKTVFYMIVFTCQKYKIYAEISSDQEYFDEFWDTYEKAAEKAKCVDKDEFKPKMVLDYFFNLDFMKTLCITLFKKIVEFVKSTLKTVKKIKEFFFGKKTDKDKPEEVDKSETTEKE